MRVLISGAHGLVGSALKSALEKESFDVRPLVRGNAGNEIWWDTTTGAINSSALDRWRPDAFVHLAGESIAGGRWTDEKKERIFESRVPATERLVSALLKLEQPPSVFVGASAVGYYGNRGGEVL